jgi:hypothetical protein
MENEELKHQGIQWLREGGEIEAAAILERCDLVERYVDTGFPLSAYPNNPDARKAIKAQAKCKKAM